MAIKYYMQFVLHEEQADPAHYSGVVEIEHFVQGTFVVEDVEEMLADTFDVDTHSVRVLEYARLH